MREGEREGGREKGGTYEDGGVFPDVDASAEDVGAHVCHDEWSILIIVVVLLLAD